MLVSYLTLFRPSPFLWPQKPHDNTMLNNGAIRKRSRHFCTMICTSSLEKDGYPTTCLDVAHYVVCVIYAKAQSEK